MAKNCLIFAPPLCGARALASHLVSEGYSPGPRCLPSRMDPSASSFEDEQTVYLNAKLFAEHKAANAWNQAVADNPFSFFLDFKTDPVTWPKSIAAPVLLAMQTQQPWVRKDSQFIYTIRYWKANVWEVSPIKPLGVFLARYPVDWIASVLHRCDHVWPHIPKDVDYLSGLWVDYMEHMMRILENPVCAANSIVLTLDHLCLAEWQQKLLARLELSRSNTMPSIQANNIRHCSRRDLQRADHSLMEVWNRWQWLVLKGNGNAVAVSA